MKLGTLILSLSSLVIPTVASTVTWAQSSPTTPAPDTTMPPSADCGGRSGAAAADCNTLRNEQDRLNNGSGSSGAQDPLDGSTGNDGSTGGTGGSGTLSPTVPGGSLGGSSDGGSSGGGGS